jgi:hypothetical protein
MNKPYNPIAAVGERDEPWSLRHTPNYTQARSLVSVDAASISPQEFHSQFVARNRPCLLRGAAKHWPAFRLWHSTSYLKGKVADMSLEARWAPAIEYLDAVASTGQRETLAKQDRSVHEPVSFHAFLDRVSAEPEQYVLHAVSLCAKNNLAVLRDDVGDYACVPQLGGQRMYVPYRAFFYRHSYTDWHYHSSDEALMTQVVGAKEVLLLPPDQGTWDALWPVVTETGRLYQVDTARFPKFANIEPFRVVVEPGDALFIPVYWWHAVASIDNKFGVTVASTFKTPLHINADWRLPGTRRLVRRFLPTRFGPLFAGAVAYAALRRLAQADFNRVKPRYARWN